MSNVLVLGALHHDVVVDAPRLPRIDETLVGTGVDYRFGGKGGNQALAAARMGATVAMAGRIGMDAAAEVMLAELETAGVDHTRVQQVPGPSGMSVAVTLPDGNYGAVIVSGVNVENDGRIDIPEDCRVCIMQNEVPEAANRTLAAALPDDVTLVLNAAPARPTDARLLTRIDVLVVNQVEAEQLTAFTHAGADAATTRWKQTGGVLVTLGAAGVLVKDEGGETHLPGHRVDVVSTHGAGDAFVGALCARLADRADLRAAVTFAQAAAALHVAAQIERRAEIGPGDVARFLQTSRP